MNIQNLQDFIDTTPTARYCSLNLESQLKGEGFVELLEGKSWEKPIEGTKGIYVIRGSSVIAIKLPKFLCGFAGVLTHSDSPCLKIKRSPELKSNGYTKLNVEPYGGAIYYSWLDKPLSISGTAMVDDEEMLFDSCESHHVVIPSQAIHINREVNNSNKLNAQLDLCPIFSLAFKNEEKSFIDYIKKAFNAEGRTIFAMDISLYNPEPVKTVELAGSDCQTLVMGPRLDNLASVYAAFQAFIDSDAQEDVAQVFVAFNGEEIGSMTHDGADGQFLSSVLERLCIAYGVDKYSAFARSVMLSVDAAHAIHPNATEKSDPSNIVKLGNGVVIKHNNNYASDLCLEAVLRCICGKQGIKCQDFYSRSDMRCGSTLGNISMRYHGIRTLDIGIPMLAMHSAVETISADDITSLERLLIEYYNTEYSFEKL